LRGWLFRSCFAEKWWVEIPPDRDFTSCLDFKKGFWMYKDVEGFIKENIVYIMNGGCLYYVARNIN